MNYKATLVAIAIFGSGLSVLRSEEPASAAIFTPAQADAGRKAYENTCGQCHTPTLLGRKGEPGELPPVSSLSESYQKFIGPRGFVPPLAGKTFMDRWGSKTAAQLIARFQETVDSFQFEPTDKEFTVNLTAYVLQVSGARAGTRPLTRNTDVIVSSVVR